MFLRSHYWTVFFSVRLLSVLRGHSVLSSPPQRFFNKGITGTILQRLWYDAVLDWGLNPGPPALEASTLPLGYRGGGKNIDDDNTSIRKKLFIYSATLYTYETCWMCKFTFPIFRYRVTWLGAWYKSYRTECLFTRQLSLLSTVCLRGELFVLICQRLVWDKQ